MFIVMNRLLVSLERDVSSDSNLHPVIKNIKESMVSISLC